MNKKNILKFILGIAIFLIIYHVLPNPIGSIITKLPFSAGNKTLLLNLVIELLAIIVIVIIYHKDLKKNLDNLLKNKSDNAKKIIIYLYYTFIFVVLANSLIINLTSKQIPTNESLNRKLTTINPLLSFVVSCLIGPLCEELIYRYQFKDVFKNKIIFIIFTGLLFGASHLELDLNIANYQNLLFIFSYAGVGMILAKCYLDTDSIFGSTLTHMLYNTICFIITIVGGL